MKDLLVSIVICTYNSANFIEDTLESAKRQTYRNIELIISDDCSTDDTVIICKRWIEQNKQHFVETKLITSLENTGVSANGNRGLRASKGEWVKPFAGDDILMDDCISSYINFISSTNGHFIFAFPSILIIPNNDALKIQKEKSYTESQEFFNLSSQKQFQYLLINGMVAVSPPTLFFRRSTFMELGGFDERYSCEDLPLYLKATFNGYSLALLKKQTVFYRIHNNQLSRKGEEGLINKYWFYEQRRIKKEYFTYKFILSNPALSVGYLIHNLTQEVIIKMGNRRNPAFFYYFSSTFKKLINSYYK